MKHQNGSKQLGICQHKNTPHHFFAYQHAKMFVPKLAWLGHDDCPVKKHNEQFIMPAAAINRPGTVNLSDVVVQELPHSSTEFRAARFAAVDRFEEEFVNKIPQQQLMAVKRRFLGKTIEAAHWAAHQKYEVSLLPKNYWEIHAFNQLMVLNDFETFKGTHKHGFEELKALKLEGIKKLIDEGRLDLDIYQPKNNELHGYGKYLLLSENLNGIPFCFQLFAFGPGQETPIHDHPCECTSTVIRGVILEKHFEVQHNHPDFNISIERNEMSQASIDLKTNLPHQIVNPQQKFVELSFTQKKGGDGAISLNLKVIPPAITVHQYVGMNGANTETHQVSQRRVAGVGSFDCITAVKNIYPEMGARS